MRCHCVFVALAAATAARAADAPLAAALVPRALVVPGAELAVRPEASDWLRGFMIGTLGVPAVDVVGAARAPPAQLPTGLASRPGASLVLQTAPARVEQLRAALKAGLGRGTADETTALEPAWPAALSVDCGSLDAGASLVARGARAETRHGPSSVEVDFVGGCGLDELVWRSAADGFAAAGSAAPAGGDSLHGVLACTPAGRGVLEALGASATRGKGAGAGARSGGCGSFARSGAAGDDGAVMDTSDPVVARALSEAVLVVMASSRAAAAAAGANGSARRHPSPLLLVIPAGQLQAKDAAVDAALTSVLAAAARAAAASLAEAAGDGRVAAAVLAGTVPARGSPGARASRVAPRKPTDAILSASRAALAGSPLGPRSLAGGNGTNGTALTEGAVLQQTILTFTGVSLIVVTLMAVLAVLSAGSEPLDRRLVARLAGLGSDRAHAD